MACGMGRKVGAAALVAGVVGVLAPLVPPGPAQAAPSSNAVTGWVSALPGPTDAGFPRESINPEVSGDGRYVVFGSTAQLTSIETGTLESVYLRDLVTDRIELISVAADGGAPNSFSSVGDISANGRYVVFSSIASDLVADDANGFTRDVFVRDRQLGTTTLVSRSSSGAQVTTDTPFNSQPRISSNGRFVLFSSRAPELLSPAVNTVHFYVRDLQTNFTERVTVSSAEVNANNNSVSADISGDGQHVAFASLATNLATDTNGVDRDVFLRNRTAGTTSIVSLTDGDVQVEADSAWPSISDNGNLVAFLGDGAMTPGDTAVNTDVFVRNVSAGTTTKISTKLGGGEADLDASIPDISGDGTTVAWGSAAGEYIAGGGNGKFHVFKRVGTGAITRESLSSSGALGNEGSGGPTLSTDGRVTAFTSRATNFAPGDQYDDTDVFVRRNPEVGPHGTTAAYSAAMVEHFTGAANATTANAMTARIGRGVSPEVEVLALAQAPAFAAKRGPLVRLYVAYFKRFPDTGGLNFWLNRLNSGWKLDQVSAQFAGSSEFKTKYGNTTNSQFVTLVYQNVLARNPDTAGLNFWVNKLNGGMSRGTVMTNFSESSEGKRKFRPWVDAALVSLGLFGRIAPSNLMTVVFNYMRDDSSERGIQRFVTSAEYAAEVA